MQHLLDSDDESILDAPHQEPLGQPLQPAAAGVEGQQPPIIVQPQPLAGGGAASMPNNPSTSQPLAGGGAANQLPPVSVASTIVAQPSLIFSTVPPTGRDPNSHHRDVSATLQSAAQALTNSGSAPPRIVASSSTGGGLAADPLGTHARFGKHLHL